MNDCQEENIYAHMDDTLFRKTGKKVSGAKWMRDPLGPPFHTNFVWGQRFLQISMQLYKEFGSVTSKSIPIDFVHCPLPVKPKKGSSDEVFAEYKEQQKISKLSKIGCERINVLRANLDNDGYADKQLIMSVDGSYTNQTVLKNIKGNTTIIGRIRKDAKLSELPIINENGRKRIYGKDLPTPEKIRQSDDYQWQTVQGCACGKVYDFQVKVIRDVRWRKSGKINLQLVVIRAVGYRKSKNANLNYREPIYLICTDPNLKIEKLLQSYLWRWGIEVNFKEQKTILGCGKAQVRKEESCENAPVFHTAVYSMLLTASEKENQQQLPRPKWYKKHNDNHNTTGDIINQFRALSWAKQAAISYDDFVNLEHIQRSRKNSSTPCFSSMFYMRK